MLRERGGWCEAFVIRPWLVGRLHIIMGGLTNGEAFGGLGF